MPMARPPAASAVPLTVIAQALADARPRGFADDLAWCRAHLLSLSMSEDAPSCG
jgi:hypothetical protein